MSPSQPAGRIWLYHQVHPTTSLVLANITLNPASSSIATRRIVKVDNRLSWSLSCQGRPSELQESGATFNLSHTYYPLPQRLTSTPVLSEWGTHLHWNPECEFQELVDLPTLHDAASSCCCQNKCWKDVAGADLVPSVVAIFKRSSLSYLSVGTISLDTTSWSPFPIRFLWFLIWQVSVWRLVILAFISSFDKSMHGSDAEVCSFSFHADICFLSVGFFRTLHTCCSIQPLWRYF